MSVRRYAARAEFRRRDRSSPWVLAGVWLSGTFTPASDEVEPVRGRLPEPGLLAWHELDEAIVGPDLAAAARIALDVARARWPECDRAPVPWSSGVAED